MSTTKQLRKRLDAALMAYIRKFEAMHGCKFEYIKELTVLINSVCFPQKAKDIKIKKNDIN